VPFIINSRDTGDDPVDTLNDPIIPLAIRDRKRVPDFGQCRSGDLVLFRGHKFDITSWAIAKAQRRAGFSAEHASWTHAAVFLYNKTVVEALPLRGVTVSSLYDYVLDHDIKIRRARVSPEAALTIALRASTTLGSQYAVWSAISLGRQLWGGLWNPIRTPILFVGRKLICSKVFYDAYAETTERQLREFREDCFRGCISPAHLSATNDFENVDIPWLRAPPP
jgi:hypothetical protein